MPLSIDQLFEDWVEPDHAQYYLACVLGLMEYDRGLNRWHRIRVLFEVRNHLGTALYRILEELVKAEVLDMNGNGQYRRNPNFSVWPIGRRRFEDPEIKRPKL